MTTAERLANQRNIEPDDLTIRLGRIAGLWAQMSELDWCQGVSEEQRLNHLVNLAMVHGDPDLAEWHYLLQKSVTAWERTFNARDSHLLLNSLDDFTRKLSQQRYDQARLDDLCCQILLQIQPAERGQSWYCSEGEIRQYVELALNPE